MSNRKVKRFLVFKFFRVQPPNGGWSDFVMSADTLEEAIQESTKSKIYDQIEIVDLELGGAVKHLYQKRKHGFRRNLPTGEWTEGIFDTGASD